MGSITTVRLRKAGGVCVRGSTSAASKNAREHRDDAENEQALANSARKMIFKTAKPNQMFGEIDDDQAVRRALGAAPAERDVADDILVDLFFVIVDRVTVDGHQKRSGHDKRQQAMNIAHTMYAAKAITTRDSKKRRVWNRVVRKVPHEWFQKQRWRG